ncbi:MAG: peptidoglycan-binding protein [Pseudomonadota bacterium]
MALAGVLAVVVGPTAIVKHSAVASPLGQKWASGAVEVVPVAVFGRDDRTPLPASFESFSRSIGLLTDGRGRAICSAFCVGNRVIVTAAHCLFPRALRALSSDAVRASAKPSLQFSSASEQTPRLIEIPKLSSLHFRLRHDGTFKDQMRTRLAGASTETVARHAITGEGATIVGGAGPVRSGGSRSEEGTIDASRDWALVRIADPVCAGHTLTVADASSRQVSAFNAKGRLFQISYHRDVADRALTHSGPCQHTRTLTAATRKEIRSNFASPDDLVLHGCDTGNASSGSPLLTIAGGLPTVVAVNVGTYVQTRLMLREGRIVHRYRATPIANTAVAASAFQHLISVLANAEIIISKQGLKQLQTALRRRGFYGGPRDGVFRVMTRRAILAAEDHLGLPVTGLPTDTIHARLLVGD